MSTTAIIDLVLTTLSLTDTAPNRAFVLSAINAAQKWAELKHDWKCTNAVGRVRLGPNGWSLNQVKESPVEEGETEFGAFKQVRSFLLVNDDGSLRPLNYIQNYGQQRMQNRVNYQEHGCALEADLILDGHWVKWHTLNAPTQLIQIEGFSVLPTLLDDEEVTNGFSWFTEHGWEFLMWYAVCFCNITVQKFVNRNEGTLSPPTRERDSAFETLLAFDCYMHDEYNEKRIIS